jgi:hypothetical protein
VGFGVGVLGFRGRCWPEGRGWRWEEKGPGHDKAMFLVFREKPRFERFFAGANDRTAPPPGRGSDSAAGRLSNHDELVI